MNNETLEAAADIADGFASQAQDDLNADRYQCAISIAKDIRALKTPARGYSYEIGSGEAID